MQTNQSDVLKESRRKLTQMESQIRQTKVNELKMLYGVVSLLRYSVICTLATLDKVVFLVAKIWVDRLYLNTNIRWYISAQ